MPDWVLLLWKINNSKNCDSCLFPYNWNPRQSWNSPRIRGGSPVKERETSWTLIIFKIYLATEIYIFFCHINIYILLPQKYIFLDTQKKIFHCHGSPPRIRGRIGLSRREKTPHKLHHLQDHPFYNLDVFYMLCTSCDLTNPFIFIKETAPKFKSLQLSQGLEYDCSDK